ncbi:MAG: 4Fe-4S binding protein [Spirochaetales bacterium]|nr:4Fe-4S binding protein [Spirochaetales bacterium]
MAKIKTYPHIDYKKCTACRECITFCPFDCLDLVVRGKDSYGNTYPGLTEKGKKECTSCGICAGKCPIGVIEMKEELPGA